MRSKSKKVAAKEKRILIQKDILDLETILGRSKEVSNSLEVVLKDLKKKATKR